MCAPPSTSRELDENLAIVEHVVERFGGLDLVYLNAGIVSGCGIGEDFDAERYRRAMSVNLDGVVYGAHAALPALRARGGGAIVATASLAGLTAVPMDPFYAANKHAVVGLTRSLGPALAGDGIRFNAICPGYAETDDHHPDPRRDRRVRRPDHPGPDGGRGRRPPVRLRRVRRVLVRSGRPRGGGVQVPRHPGPPDRAGGVVPAVHLVRHAQASFGAADYDVLSDLGHRQVEALDDTLRDRGLRPLRVVSGTLRRQQDTAKLSVFTGTDVEVDERWNEYDSEAVLAAHADGIDPAADRGAEMTSRELQPLLDGALGRWVQAGADSTCRETWPAFAGRTRGALEDLVGGLDRGEHALVVTSGGVIGAICAALVGAGEEPSAFVAFNRATVNGGITTLLRGRSGTTLLTYNEHAYLQEAGLVTFR